MMSRTTMGRHVYFGSLLAMMFFSSFAQPSFHSLLVQKDARAIVTAAAAAELEADHSDHTAYIYRDHDITPAHDTLYLVIETPQGNLRRKLEDHGRPLNPKERKADDARIHALLADKQAQEKMKANTDKDDGQAEQLLKLLPSAFLWTVISENGDLVTLAFTPDPAFRPENMEARVFAGMEGQIVVARSDNRIRSMRGKMIADVKIPPFGLLGSLHKGGTFQVERREVAPHHWQVTELHVHIEGKAFFTSIGSQEDETENDFKPSPAKTLQDAWEIANKMP